MYAAAFWVRFKLWTLFQAVFPLRPWVFPDKYVVSQVLLTVARLESGVVFDDHIVEPAKRNCRKSIPIHY